MSPLLGVAAAVLAFVSSAAGAERLNLGNKRQLFVDSHLLAEKKNVELVLHQPVPREIVLTVDKPWEDNVMTYVSVMKDGNRFLMYYRGTGADEKYAKDAPAGMSTGNWTYTAVAESTDGIKWTKPVLNLVEFKGSKANNLIWPTDANKPWRDKNYPGTDIFPFRDENPNVAPDQRFKALANIGEYELAALVSPDGFRWKPLREKPVISFPSPNPMMDPPSVTFWDPNTRQYVGYLRHWINYRIRGFRRVTSPDYVNWSEPQVVNYLNGEVEQLYTSMAIAYDRAPDTYLFFSKRFARWKKKQPSTGVSEIVFLSSRDGLNFDRTFMEPFLPPGLDKNNWHPRGVMMGRGILETSPTELSLYYIENYGLPSVRVRRATLRPDGFVSVHAPWAGGEFTTPPFVYDGSELELNFATSAAGSIRVEIQDENGQAIPGFRIEDCDEIFGDELDRTVTWARSHDMMLNEKNEEIPYPPGNFGRPLAGKTIRLRFVMKAAELYSFRIK
ncbi:MAG: hypothetical protein JNG83_03685 [Opitutaceae bacterium]|nr:hypothetical protein [Opitutaceae bacterium]